MSFSRNSSDGVEHFESKLDQNISHVDPLFSVSFSSTEPASPIGLTDYVTPDPSAMIDSPKHPQNSNRNNSSDKQNDPLYLERRRKNNEAARKSREAKKQRVVDNVKLITELESENRTIKSMIMVEKEHIQILEQSVRSVLETKHNQHLPTDTLNQEDSKL